MRFGGNFHPEWGYLAPVPSVMRTARIVAVATAIGATAGAAVVLSLADRPAPVMAASAGQTLVVVHSLVQPAEASVPAAPVASTTPVAEPVAAATPAAAPVIAAMPAKPATPTKAEAPAQAKLQVSAPSAPPPMPPSATASAENPPAIVMPPAASESAAADAAPVAPEPSAVQTAAVKKPHVNEHDTMRPPLAVAAAPRKKPAESGLAPILRRLFSAHAGNTRAN